MQNAESRQSVDAMMGRVRVPTCDAIGANLSSCQVYDCLHHRQMTACGTMRANRCSTTSATVCTSSWPVNGIRSGPLLCLKYKGKKGHLYGEHIS